MSDWSKRKESVRDRVLDSDNRPFDLTRGEDNRGGGWLDKLFGQSNEKQRFYNFDDGQMRPVDVVSRSGLRKLLNGGQAIEPVSVDGVPWEQFLQDSGAKPTNRVDAAAYQEWIKAKQQEQERQAALAEWEKQQGRR